MALFSAGSGDGPGDQGGGHAPNFKESLADFAIQLVADATLWGLVRTKEQLVAVGVVHLRGLFIALLLPLAFLATVSGLF
jgi:hypothetical protein